MKNSMIFIIILISFSATAQQYWQPLRADQWPDYGVHSLYVDQEVDILYFGGNFGHIKNAAGENLLLLNGIGMWNGTEYKAMGVGQEQCFGGCANPVRQINKYNNKIIVGTGYDSVDSLQVNGIAAWDGIEWDSLRNGIVDEFGEYGIVHSSLVLNNELIVGGSLTGIGGMPASLGKWNGQEWSVIPFPTNLNSTTPLITAIAFYNGELYVGGNFKSMIDGEIYSDILKYDGTAWHPVYGSIRGSSYLTSMTIFQDHLYVAGAFSQAAGNAGNNIMRLGPNGWEDVHGGVWGENIYQVYALLVHNNALYVSGAFDVVGDGVQARSIAKWDGEKWCALGGGGTLGYFVVDMAIYRDTLIVASKVDLDNGTTIKNIAKWTGGDYVENCGLPVAATVLPTDGDAKLSPNPVSDLLHLQLGGFHTSVQVRIFNALGQEIYETQVDATPQVETLRIPVAASPPGVYSVQIESGGKVLTRQVAVQR